MPNSAQTVPPGRAYLETAVHSVRSNDRSVRTSFVPVLLRVGVLEDLELRALLNVVAHERAPAGDSTWGGPLQLGFKLRFNRGGAGFGRPSFGLEGGLVLPVASAGRSGGKLVPSLTLNVDHFVTQSGTLTWNLGALAPVDELGVQHAQGFFGAAYTQSLTDTLQLFVAGDAAAPVASSGGGSLANLGTGGYWYASKRVVLFGAINWGLTGNSPRSGASVGLSYAF